MGYLSSWQNNPVKGDCDSPSIYKYIRMHSALIFCQSFIHYNITSYFQKPLPPTAKHTHTLTHKHQLPSSNLPKCSELILYHRYDYSNFAWAVILWHSIQAYGWIINPWKWMRALSGVFFLLIFVIFHCIFIQ